MLLRPLRFSALTVALSYIAVSLIVLILFTTPVLYAWHEIVEERSTERLKEDAQRLSNVLKNHGAMALNAVIDAMSEAQTTGDEKFILLADPDLNRISGNLASWPAVLPTTLGTHTVSFNYHDQTVRAIFVYYSLSNGDKLIVGRNISKFRTVESLFWIGLIGAICTVLAFGILSGYLIRRALLNEVKRISETAEAIIAGDLSYRLPHNGEAYELDILAHTLNRMLDQIEQLIKGILNVSNSIAHDLRTPLSELRTRLEELTLSRPPQEQTFSDIETAVNDVDRVIAIFNALLRLAEIDNGARRSGFIDLNIEQVANEAVEFYRPLAELRGITLQFICGGHFSAPCDPVLLSQAVSNLIDNALKYARSIVSVNVTAGNSDQSIAIAVTDDGPGIPDEEKSKVVERFYRGDSSRGTPGVGLGLSLVKAVAKLHGGTLKLSDATCGLHATLTIAANRKSKQKHIGNVIHDSFGDIAA